MCMRVYAGVWHHIHLVCCYNTTQLLAAASETGKKKKLKKRELKFESNRKVKLHFEILMYSAFVRAAGLTTASSKICTQVVWESDRV